MNTIPEIGRCRKKNNVWWFYTHRQLLGNWKKGFHVGRKYKYKIINDERCLHDGQKIGVVKLSGRYCAII